MIIKYTMAKRKTNKSSSSKKTINKKPIKNEVNSKRKGNKKNNKTTNKKEKEKEKEQENPSNNESNNEDEKKQLQTVVSKNGAIVDLFVPNQDYYHVVPAKPSQYHNPFFSCTLNYSNVARNNNKFYIIQLLQNEKDNKYYIFLRWGRVGRNGQTNLIQFSSLEDGIQFYIDKYQGKTEYGYVEIKLNYEEDKDKMNIDDKKESNESKLEKKVNELIKVLYDINSIDEQMKEIGYDSSKMPLGRLSKENLNEGMTILKKIENVINEKEKGNLADLSSQFYTIIPHNFGFYNMAYFKISTLEEVKEKIDLLESLKDINVISKVIKEEKENDTKKNSLDTYYANLHCTIKAIDDKDPIYSILNQYLTTSTTLPSSPQLTLLEVFELSKENDAPITSDNNMLLWYGTRSANYVSLITEGFRLPSPDSPATAFNFGKGIYFSDMSLKYANPKCFQHGKGFLMLCAVELGNVEERKAGDYNLPNTMKEGSNSIKACGMNVPDKKDDYVDKEKGYTIPIGKPIKSDAKSFFGFNQYIVYDCKKIHMKYLLKVKINNK